ncbi:MAG: hypothetical protein RR248_02540 [Clostridia bacterium]
MKDYARAKKILCNDNCFTNSLEVFEADLKEFVKNYFEISGLDTSLVFKSNGFILNIVLDVKKGKNFNIVT